MWRCSRNISHDVQPTVIVAMQFQWITPSSVAVTLPCTNLADVTEYILGNAIYGNFSCCRNAVRQNSKPHNVAGMNTTML